LVGGAKRTGIKNMNGANSVSSPRHQSWSYASRNEYTVHHKSNFDVAFRSHNARVVLENSASRCGGRSGALAADDVVYYFGRSMTYAQKQ